MKNVCKKVCFLRFFVCSKLIRQHVLTEEKIPSWQPAFLRVFVCFCRFALAKTLWRFAFMYYMCLSLCPSDNFNLGACEAVVVKLYAMMFIGFQLHFASTQHWRIYASRFAQAVELAEMGVRCCGYFITCLNSWKLVVSSWIGKTHVAPSRHACFFARNAFSLPLNGNDMYELQSWT